MSTKLQDYIQKSGRFPRVSLQIKPIDPARRPVELNEFTDYNFQSSVIVPVSAFTFRMVNPTKSGSLLNIVRDGDIAILKANGVVIATGLIDTVSVETGNDGESVELYGRSLLGQLEDQAAISETDKPLFGQTVTLAQAVQLILANTRINYYRLQQPPNYPPLMFATEPGESKMSALMRFIEPQNCILWMDPDGTLVVGRPNMGAFSTGTFAMDRENKTSNCLSMKAVYSSTQIPTSIVPIWSGSELAIGPVVAAQPEQRLLNTAQGPSTLRGFGHRVPKAIVVSTPNGNSPQELSQANQFSVAGGSNVLQAYAKREIARANVNEIGVQVNIQGHYDDDLNPVLPDKNYTVNYMRAGLSEKMYLHTVEYGMTKDRGQRTALYFTRLGSIVADVPVKSLRANSQRIQVKGSS